MKSSISEGSIRNPDAKLSPPPPAFVVHRFDLAANDVGIKHTCASAHLGARRGAAHAERVPEPVDPIEPKREGNDRDLSSSQNVTPSILVWGRCPPR